jgi:uncharacterized protein
MSIAQRIAQELSVSTQQVDTAIDLLDDGATVPFIARYRKEKTKNLDDSQLRLLETRLQYLRELQKRKDTILKSVKEQGKLSKHLESLIQAADTRTDLEDIYLPYKPKRRTKAQIAREAGLAPLAEKLLNNAHLVPEEAAQPYLNSEQSIHDVNAALEGARQILMEQFAENATLLGQLRQDLWQGGVFNATLIKGKETLGEKFKDYFDYKEAIKNIPSHRALALFRGRTEKILRLNLDLVTEVGQLHPSQRKIAQHYQIQAQNRPADAWLLDTVRWAWRVKIHSKLVIDLSLRLREAAELEAINVFSKNFKDLLLAAPAGDKTTMGLDPGIRTGVKVAIVDATGKLLETSTIYPHPPRKQWDQSIEILNKLALKHQVQLVSIGNGTASRETDQLVADLIQRYPNLTLSKLMTSEAGASVYSASELAAKEFPDLDVSLRGAVSIARRLQDPLAELVKIEPKAIGVGQYQHDVNQVKLSHCLDATVEDCVNAVGVDVNTASAVLLSHIAGLNRGLAENIVLYRNEHGVFRNRNSLKKVKRLGPKAFEQAAGFLRITKGDNPLDASAVHPEAYSVVKKISQQTHKSIPALIGQSALLKPLQAMDYVDEQFGLPTIKDIFAELEKPGRDPRPEFITACFKEGINHLKDLYEGLLLEGVVSNVTNFGAFIDIGVHQDGLVHISQLADSFVKDPRDIVKVGEVVNVRVTEIDIARKRVALSMKKEASHSTSTAKIQSKPKTNNAQKVFPRGKKQSKSVPTNAVNSAMADAFLKAR